MFEHVTHLSCACFHMDGGMAIGHWPYGIFVILLTPAPFSATNITQKTSKCYIWSLCCGESKGYYYQFLLRYKWWILIQFWNHLKYFCSTDDMHQKQCFVSVWKVSQFSVKPHLVICVYMWHFIVTSLTNKPPQSSWSRNSLEAKNSDCDSPPVFSDTFISSPKSLPPTN